LPAIKASTLGGKRTATVGKGKGSGGGEKEEGGKGAKKVTG